MNDQVPFSAVAIFAEDGRDELAGTLSLIGIMPDTVALTAFPAALPKLYLYIRISYDPNDPPSSVSSGLRVGSAPPMLTQTLAAGALQQSIDQTLESGAQIGSIVARFGMVHFDLDAPCVLNATVTWNDAEYIVGSLRVRQA